MSLMRGKAGFLAIKLILLKMYGTTVECRSLDCDLLLVISTGRQTQEWSKSKDLTMHLKTALMATYFVTAKILSFTVFPIKAKIHLQHGKNLRIPWF